MKRPLSLCAATILLCSTASGQSSRFDRAGSPGQNLVTLNSSNQSTVSLTGVTLLDLELVGYARKDRFRVNLPRPVSEEQHLPDHVMLPGGGSLWRAAQGQDGLLLWVTPSGELRELLREPGLQARISVTPSGDALLAAAGDHVWRVELPSQAAQRLTPSGGLSGLDPKSLRVNDHAVYLVADGEVHRSLTGGPLLPLQVQLLPDEEVLSELVLALHAPVALAMTEGDDETERRLLALSPTGTQVLTPQPRELSLPEMDEPLGPFVAVSPLGTRAAWRTPGASEELFIENLGIAGPGHVTGEPDFPVYIDNIGVLAFGTDARLCFFAGDRQISGITGSELIGAADMYAITFAANGSMISRNVSGTSNSFVPPFALAGTLTMEEAFVDPAGERFLVVEEPPQAEERVSCFAIETLPGQPGFGTTVVADDRDDLEFHAAGLDLILVSELEYGPVSVQCIPPFDPSGAAAQHLLLTRPSDTRVREVRSFGGKTVLRLQPSGGGQEEVVWCDRQQGTVQQALPLSATGVTHYGRSLGFDPFGHLILAAGPSPTRVYWLRSPLPMLARVLWTPPRNGLFLPY